MPGPDDESGHRPLVLVVDDIRSARIVAERILRRHGYEVISAENVAAALSALASHPVSAVVADWAIPGGGDGLSLLEAVHDWWPGVSRILWPADPLGCELARQRGIECVEKGDHHLALIATLRRLLGQDGGAA